MTTLSLPSNAVGVELPNGKKIDADKNGKVIIDDPKEEKMALKSGAAAIGIVARQAFSFDNPEHPSRFCRGCSFRGFEWQKVCPKCNDKMMTPKEGQ